jgi:prepilin-type N-terminal cleavage/methylation domain-containing protein
MIRVHSSSPANRRRGFTLVEVLITLVFLGIVLPTIMKGIAMASSIASDSRRRTEVAGLAQAKLAEIVADDLWETANLSGDFSPDFPQYHWQATAQAWAGDQTGVGMQEIDLTVSWVARNRQQSMIFSTLAYQRTQQ